ncbi:curlin subunit CsgB [Vibrio fluvialis]
MSNRITAYVMKLFMLIALAIVSADVAWSAQRPEHSGHDLIAIGYGDSSMGGFGNGIGDLSTFNELEDIVTADNYAEVEMENAIGGRVSIQQLSGLTGNKAKVVQQNSRGSEARIWQGGSENIALVTQTGTGNDAFIGQHGYSNNAWINQNGNYNIAAIIQNGSGSSMSINQRGNNNQAYLVDNGGSNYGISQNGNDYVAIIGGSGINVFVTQY